MLRIGGWRFFVVDNRRDGVSFALELWNVALVVLRAAVNICTDGVQSACSILEHKVSYLSCTASCSSPPTQLWKYHPEIKKMFIGNRLVCGNLCHCIFYKGTKRKNIYSNSFLFAKIRLDSQQREYLFGKKELYTYEIISVYLYYLSSKRERSNRELKIYSPIHSNGFNKKLDCIFHQNFKLNYILIPNSNNNSMKFPNFYSNESNLYINIL